MLSIEDIHELKEEDINSLDFELNNLTEWYKKLQNTINESDFTLTVNQRRWCRGINLYDDGRLKYAAIEMDQLEMISHKYFNNRLIPSNINN